MDWYLDRADQVSELRREIARYLIRHALPGSDDAVADAELVVSEAVGNAIRHAGGPVWVSLEWTSELPLLRVFDIGPGFDPTADPRHLAATAAADDAETDWADAESGRGLLIMQMLSAEVAASVRRHAGTVVTIQLAVRRSPTEELRVPRLRADSLPALEEARADGAFGKESFLRALVVQLSQAVEDHHGPVAAESAVAQVGTDVGGRMEEEFRLAEEVVGRLTPEQMGRCYVRLKHAIDGDFHVVEATPQRIVLENTRCPFGTAVQRSPTLCLMTSSVFGGIAARNSDDGATVLLEERIAVGDPGCRVVVYLGEAPESARAYGHRYAAPTADAL